MNLEQFKSNIESLLSNHEVKNWEEIINKLAEFIDEDHRLDTIEILKATITPKISDELKLKNFTEEIEEIKTIIENIKNGNLYIEEFYDEEFSYNFHYIKESPYDYRDTTDLVPNLKRLSLLIGYLYHYEQYNAVYKLGSTLLNTPIRVLDGQPYDEFIEETEKDFLSVARYFKVFLYEETIKKIVDSGFRIGKITLTPKIIEDLYSTFPEVFWDLESLLPYLHLEEDQLLKLLKNWLTNITENSLYSNSFYVETALDLINDKEFEESFLLKHINILTDQFLTYYYSIRNLEEKIALGLKALDKMNEQFYEREIIIKDLIPHLIERSTDSKAFIKLFLECFYINPSLFNYFNIFINNTDLNIDKEITSFIKSLKKDKNKYHLLHFFNEEFDYCLNLLSKPAYASTPSNNFTKYFLTLFMALLLENKESTSLNELLIDFENYFSNSSLDHFINLDTHEFYSFRSILNKWLRKVQASLLNTDDIIKRVNEILDRYLRAIMSKQRRSHYNKAVLLMNAFGDILESRGLMSKHSYIQKYYDRYSDDRSLVRALKRHGFDVHKGI